MTLEEFKATLSDGSPPARLPGPLQALWLDARDDWEGAHEAAQRTDDDRGAWVHAYLHRKEGDAGNAAYWYRRAGRAVCRQTLDEEWASIVEALLVDVQ
jgi:hypothetical protein